MCLPGAARECVRLSFFSLRLRTQRLKTVIYRDTSFISYHFYWLGLITELRVSDSRSLDQEISTNRRALAPIPTLMGNSKYLSDPLETSSIVFPRLAQPADIY